MNAMKKRNNKLPRIRMFIAKALGKLGLVSKTRTDAWFDYLVISHSGLFDSMWYTKTYASMLGAQTNPVMHYCTQGWFEGCNPSQSFDTMFYLNEYRDVRSSNMNPFVHYILYGWQENRHPVENPVQMDVPLVQEELNLKQHAARIARFKSNPLISVIVASYNYENFIGETLESIIKQTYANIEVIVVDDGSKDSSVAKIKEFAARDQRIKLYQHEGGVNKGLKETIKLALSKANGEYVAFCESDDILMQNNLEEKVAALNKSKSRPKILINGIAAFGDAERCLQAKSAVELRMSALKSGFNRISALDFRKRNWICTFSCCMVDRLELLNCDFDSCPRIANIDWWLWRQVCCVNQVYVIEDKLTGWRMHTSYMVNEKLSDIKKQREFIHQMDAMLVSRFGDELSELKKVVEDYEALEFSGGKVYISGELNSIQPAFSIVMPTYNRRSCIDTAVDSVLNQTYQNFELIIVDDGSSDGTEEFLREKYREHFDSGKIKYVLSGHVGVCKARNIGLEQIKNEWVAYVDSDNEVCPFFLETYVRNIIRNPERKNFYARLVHSKSRQKVGRAFDYEKLKKFNFIDLGVYVHHASIIKELGGFDEKMTRLVDWELILRQCAKYEPLFIDEILLLYNDADSIQRITNTKSLKKNLDYIRKKHFDWPTVTTMITAYNHEKYIKRAIESAVMQKGEFIHNILVSDDGSTDGTRQVIKEMMALYPDYINDISSDVNMGISKNMKKCFDNAQGDFVAILEGDDYWSIPWKLNRQIKFLMNHPKCPLCFSRITLLFPSGSTHLLKRQNRLASELTGKDFIKDPCQNPIANFSSCMFRTSVVHSFPDILFSTRFNEIACSFYVEKLGPIGYMSDVMSVYRIHEGGVWSAAEEETHYKSAIESRKVALAVCAPKYKRPMERIIKKIEKKLKALGK